MQRLGRFRWFCLTLILYPFRLQLLSSRQKYLFITIAQIFQMLQLRYSATLIDTFCYITLISSVLLFHHNAFGIFRITSYANYIWIHPVWLVAMMTVWLIPIIADCCIFNAGHFWEGGYLFELTVRRCTPQYHATVTASRRSPLRFKTNAFNLGQSKHHQSDTLCRVRQWYCISEGESETVKDWWWNQQCCLSASL